MTTEYRDRARTVFGKLKTAMENPNDNSVPIEDSYWRFACTFDTMTDYLLLLKDSSEKADLDLYASYRASLAGQLNSPLPSGWATRVDPYAQYLKTMVQYGHACCYDDFCWWGIVSAKALPKSPYYDMFLDLFGADGVSDFQNAAIHIWEVVNHGNYDAIVKTVPTSYPGYDKFKENYAKRPAYHGGSPNVWDRVINDQPAGVKDYFDGVTSLKPRYKGGMWQYDYYWDPINKTDSFKTGGAKESCAQNGDPRNTMHRIGPFQNTLMSNLVVIYGSRLHSWGGAKENDEYLTVAKRVKGFMTNWLTLEGVSGDTSNDQLLWHYDNNPNGDKVLVRERVGTYEAGKVPGYWTSDKFPNIQPDVPTNRVWTGDQGLLIGGLVEYELANGSPEDINEHITSIVTGTLDTGGKLFYPANSTSGGSLQHYQPWEKWGNAADLFCLRDYWSGAGVFWRYLVQTYKTNDAVRKVVNEILSEENNAIIQSADAAMLDPTIPWGPQENTKSLVEEVGALFQWFSPLATLTAAIYILENKDS